MSEKEGRKGSPPAKIRCNSKNEPKVPPCQTTVSAVRKKREKNRNKKKGPKEISAFKRKILRKNPTE